ncbi:MAG: tetratricopeptide repeat protein [Muribaculaceae bacterium]|nr:tetratricopeptide repeat protein [Muribaculaceae bacterium]
MTEFSNDKQVCVSADELISAGRFEDALALLDKTIEDTPSADLFYQRGRLLWKLGRKTEAMSDYGRAVELDAESPAATALELAREVMNFYNKDLYNP